MLRSLKTLQGYTIRAKSGDIGKLHGFIFDDQAWQIHHIEVTVAGTEDQPGLLQPSVVGRPDWENNIVPVRVTEAAPYHVESNLKNPLNALHFTVIASDGQAGTVEDMIFDDEKWFIRYLVISTHKLLPGGKVLVTVDMVRSINWHENKLYVDETTYDVRHALPFVASAPVNHDLEGRRFDYYGRPVVGEVTPMPVRPEFPCPKCGAKFLSKFEEEDHAKICGTPAAERKHTLPSHNVVERIERMRWESNGSYRQSNRST